VPWDHEHGETILLLTVIVVHLQQFPSRGGDDAVSMVKATFDSTVDLGPHLVDIDSNTRLPPP